MPAITDYGFGYNYILNIYRNCNTIGIYDNGRRQWLWAGDKYMIVSLLSSMSFDFGDNYRLFVDACLNSVVCLPACISVYMSLSVCVCICLSVYTFLCYCSLSLSLSVYSLLNIIVSFSSVFLFCLLLLCVDVYDWLSVCLSVCMYVCMYVRL